MPGFQDIHGQDHIKIHFKKAIENNKVSHAYILSGEAGTGRKSLANAFALTLLCEKGGTNPCLPCHSCSRAIIRICFMLLMRSLQVSAWTISGNRSMIRL